MCQTSEFSSLYCCSTCIMSWSRPVSRNRDAMSGFRTLPPDSVKTPEAALPLPAPPAVDSTRPRIPPSPSPPIPRPPPMKIYTRTGDAGETGLIGGGRVPKDDERIDAYGQVDELNASLGVARAAILPPDIDREIAAVQHDLFVLGADLADPRPTGPGQMRLDPAAAARLEQAWQRHRHGYAIVRATTPSELKRFRELRKAGLGLLSAAGQGNERSIAFVEDTAVDPRRLAAYTDRFARLLERHGLRAGFYGHASAGCLHIRPFMDLGRPGEVARMRAVAGEVAALVSEFGGMNSSEHGDGLVRAEFSRRLFGDELYEAMRELKRAFDPSNRLNPGKKVDAPAMTEHLREPALPRSLPLATVFPFAFADGMRGAANRCVRVGACRKSAASGGTMCPSYMATRDERHSTRGRANALVAALSSPDPRAALGDDALMDVLDLCLECKACKSECPMSVDMATLKAEALYQRHAAHGTPIAARLFGHARAVNRAGSASVRLT
ncbi:MAG: 4Fe-4S dicluster domain-containing protein, partial [Candidatus Brocadiae bacterium]|nr:4Fe-4S dicluster domain-containing protein [Candidatus Brocadiia bacterium]